MLKINKFFLYFIISIFLHILFFFFIFCAKKNPVYLFTPIDVTFYSPNQNIEELSALPTIEETSVNKAKDVSDTKESAKEDVKEQIKNLAKTKGDILVKKEKNPIKKVKDGQENNNNAKHKKSIKKTEPVKKASYKPSVPIETAQPLKSDVLSNGNGSLYTGAFFDTNDFKYPYYTKQIRRKVASQWCWAESYVGFRVLLYFKINRDGSVGDILVKESSGNEDYDKNALHTILRAAPFPSLPDGYEGKSLGVFFEFEIKY
jgi:TonB family protein